MFFEGKNMTVAGKLVKHAMKMFIEDIIPTSVTSVAVKAIVDQYGLQIGGSSFPWSKSIYSFCKNYEQSYGNSTITFYGVKSSPVQAAFINGCFAHAQDFDDSHQEAQTHPGSVVIPAARLCRKILMRLQKIKVALSLDATRLPMRKTAHKQERSQH